MKTFGRWKYMIDICDGKKLSESQLADLDSIQSLYVKCVWRWTHEDGNGQHFLSKRTSAANR